MSNATNEKNTVLQDVELKPINATNQDQEQERKAFADFWQDDAWVNDGIAPNTLNQSVVNTPQIAPNIAPEIATSNAQNAVSGSLKSTAVKASTVSSNDGVGWKILGGALLLGGLGAAAAGGGGGKKSDNSNTSNNNNPQTTPKTEPTLSAPVLTVDKIAPISQNNQNQTFTLSGSLKTDPNATKTEVWVSVNGKSAQAATVSANKWTLTLSGSNLAQNQGDNVIVVSSVSHGNGKSVQGKTVSANYFVDTQITTPKVSLDDVADKLSTEKQTITLSGSLTNVDKDATAQIAVKINNGTAKIAQIQGDKWTLQVAANEIVGKLGENRIDVLATATDTSGNVATHSASDVYNVIAPTETQIFYSSGKNETVSGSTATAFDTSVLHDNRAFFNSENAILTRYIKEKGETTVSQNIEKAYAIDTDHDGVIDKFDANPSTWDVSERDLRMFATLAYQDSSVLKQAFNDKNQTAINKVAIKSGFWSDKNFFLEQFDIQDEAIGKWDVLEAEHHDNGLDYVIFGNGKKANGSYENVVVAFRGTESSKLADLWSDLQLTFKGKPDQVEDFENIATRLMQKYQPTNVYSTGHSLGGYLSQYFSAYTMQQTAERRTAFKHNAIFNPAKITASESSSLNVQEALKTSEKFYNTNLTDNSDKSETIQKHKSDSYVIDKEWVSNGASWGAVFASAFISPTIALALAAYRGLGKYPNTTDFTFKSSDIWGKHDMTSFYEKDSTIKQYFSKGYRIDKNYLADDTDKDGFTDYQEKRIGTDFRTATNLNGTDSDNDGFSDHLEIKLGTDWQNADEIVQVRDFVDENEWNSPILAVAATHTSDDNHAFLGATGYVLSPELNGNDLSYTATGETVNLGILNNAEWQNFINAGSQIFNGTNNNDYLSGSHEARIVYGGKGDDILISGDAQTVLIGGEGNDIFAFTASSLLSGSLNIIADLANGDKLDFSDSSALFSDRDFSHLTWSNLLGDTVAAFDHASALIWQDDSKTLAYKASTSNDLHVFARFDETQNFASIQAAIIG